MRLDDHNMPSHYSQIFLLLIERSVCWVQSDDCANSLDIGENNSFLFRSRICLLLQNTSSRGSVDAGSVDLVECIMLKSVFSPKHHGEECLLTSR